MSSDEIKRRIAERRAAGDYDDAALPDDPDQGLVADTFGDPRSDTSMGGGITNARIRGELQGMRGRPRYAQLMASLGLAVVVVVFLVAAFAWPGFLVR